MANPNVLIILLNWNGWVDTRECIESLLKLTDIAFTIAIVDNGSEADIEQIRNYGKDKFDHFYEYERAHVVNNADISPAMPGSLILVRNNENLGFAKANNVGIRLGELLGFEFIYLLNNDTVVEPDSLARLTAVLQNSDYAAVVPQIRYYSPNDVVWCCGGELKNFYEYYHFKGDNISVVPKTPIIDIGFATGCALLFKRSKINQLSEKFFFGEEDAELSLRLKKQKLRMACVVDAIVYHKESVSINRSTKSLNKAYVHKLNRLINIKDYAPFTWPFIIGYRSFKFFLLMLLIEKKSLPKSAGVALGFTKRAFTLKEVNKNTFFSILNMDLS